MSSSVATVSESGTMNRMQKRSLRTRNRLLSATATLVVEKGVEKTTMDDISELADLGRRTLYYHFESKDECILEAVAQTYQKHAELYDETHSEGIDPALRVAIASLSVMNAIVSEPITAQVIDYPKLLAEALTRSVLDYALKDIGEGIAQNRLTLAHSQDALIRILTWGLVAAIMSIINEETGAHETFTTYANVFLVSLGVESEEASKIVVEAQKFIENNPAKRN